GSIDVASKILTRARTAGRRANVTISAAFGCPFEGEVAVERVVDMARQLADAEPREIAIADTIGVGDPAKTLALIEGLRSVTADLPLRVHFHNTRNTAIANAYVAASAGVATLDGSMGGIGGCPFAPNATGNVPSEDLVYMLERAGFDTGIDLEGLIAGANWLSDALGKPLPGMVSRAGSFPKSEHDTEPKHKELETT
ncbi:MAG: hydroxymethylglutaryl-CoA lyase, partial [Pseudomonadota bacterium]